MLVHKQNSILGASNSAFTPEKKLSNTSLPKGDSIETNAQATDNKQPSAENSIPEVVLEKPLLKTLVNSTVLKT